MIELTCKKDGCDEVVNCDEGVVAVTCSLCCMADVITQMADSEDIIGVA
tara:strand:- start:212 stop:358 length:147 start_codon:yes stop_codon:yes gene_type:complete